MSNQGETYRKMREKYTAEEIVESMHLPGETTPEEEQAFVKLRMERWHNRSSEEIMLGKLLQLKNQIGNYVASGSVDEEKSLGWFLKKYIEISGKSSKEIGKDIDIHPSRLSRILNDKERFGKTIAFRLEGHSGELIPAIYWWKLVKKEEEQEIIGSKKERKEEHSKVKNKLYEAKVP
ncbi:MAG: hypothetical protein R2828_29730 [Saprospiraceae bacterium]